jgi:lipid-A-disaccharide synthase
MNKTFIVTGELSGDKLAAWYVDFLEQDTAIEAIGGHFLEAKGITLHDRIEKLSFVGVVEIIRHLPFILSYIKKLAAYITQNNFTHVVLVDFPGFNLLLAKRLKAANAALEITYLSPPQLWVWGAWRIKKIKRYISKVVVIYPFEVEWYKARGVQAQWLGYPFGATLKPFFDLPKTKRIAIIPASRTSEIELLFPLFVECMRSIKAQHPTIRFILPVAQSLSKKVFIDALAKAHAAHLATSIDFIENEAEKYEALSSCILAITKPGTVTLELALLGVPMLIVYKTSALTYAIARTLASVSHMGLPNLLLKAEVAQEFIQDRCSPALIMHHANLLLKDYESGHPRYEQIRGQTSAVRTTLKI